MTNKIFHTNTRCSYFLPEAYFCCNIQYVSLKKKQLLHSVIPFWPSQFRVYVWGHCDGDVTHGELFEKIIWHTFSGTTRLNAHRLTFVQNFCVCVLPMCALLGRNKDSMNILTLEASNINTRQFLHLFIPPAHREFRHSLKNEIKNLFIFREAVLF